jgi:replicative DNA helicase
VTVNISGMVDKRNIFLLLGVYCNNPKLILNDKYETNANDYSEAFHKMVFGAIYNIAKKGSVSKITSIEIENELAQFESTISLWRNNNGADYIERAIEETEDKLLNIGMYYDNVRKYSILRQASEMLKMDVSFLYDENDENKIKTFTEMDSNKVLGIFLDRFNNFKGMWKSSFGDNFSFHAGDNIRETLKNCKNKDTSFGYPFQSQYMTTAFRGMKSKKFILRSSISGGGKTRNSLAEACNIASDRIYDWSKHEWISTGTKSPVLFISTELMPEELQTCLLAHISGIDEDRIVEWKDITEEEERILEESTGIVEESILLGEYMPDFTIVSIEEKISEYVINHNITHCFFDYINDSPSLYSYYIQKTGVRLQTHQILFLFSASLKQLANKYNIYLGSATQMSSNWKEEKDANALKGSKAIAEKADGGILAIPVSSPDLKKLKPIMETGFYDEPNMAYYIYKNRGNRWNNIIVWTRINMGTVREKDCFVTDNDYKLVDNIEKTLLEFTLDDIGDTSLMEIEDLENVKNYVDEFNKVKAQE